jgi:hypothetical protein
MYPLDLSSRRVFGHVSVSVPPNILGSLKGPRFEYPLGGFNYDVIYFVQVAM